MGLWKTRKDHEWERKGDKEKGEGENKYLIILFLLFEGGPQL